MDCSHDELDSFACGGPPPGRRARRNAVPDVGESLRLEMQMTQMENQISMCRLSIGGGGRPQHEAPPGWAPPDWGCPRSQEQLAFSLGPSAAAGGAGEPGGPRGPAGGAASTITNVATFACYDDPELEPFAATGLDPAAWSEPVTGAAVDTASLPSLADFDRIQGFAVQEAGKCGRWGSNRSTGSCHSAMSFMSDDVYRP